MKRLFLIIGMGSLVVVTGCTDMSPRQQGTVSGAAIGAASGAGIAAISGGDVWTGAAIGGVAGGVAGNIHGGRR
ncbi:YMGG-like glycine zipper-containing protein [Pandoraea pnomenusa]|uniref:YMGG-like glycine zipper-containing protein n=1 Tax=Pandoraea pnomenusa TaxID=93220 RepID=UPI00333E7592